MEETTAELTGNHYLSFPRIAKADGSVDMLSAMHAGLGGIVAWHGDPLIKLSFARGDAEPQPLQSLSWQRFDRWIPHAESAFDKHIQIDMTFCAPGGYEPLARGGFITCVIHNRSREDIDIAAVLDIRISNATLHIAAPRPLHTFHTIVGGAMQKGIAVEIGAPVSDAALGFACDDDSATYYVLDGEHERVAVDATVERRAMPSSLHAQIRTDTHVRAGKNVRRTFFVGVGRDRDSALGHAAHLIRLGAPALLREARLELAHLTRRTPDVQLSELLNRNLLFNHYFGLARALDDDRLYAVSSRFPDHMPGAAVNEREMLFWTLPCITMTDPLLARELLRDAFEVYSAQPGMQWRYLDGGVIEPGFSLEQALLYPLAVERYVREADDPGLLDDPLIQDVLREIDGGLDGRLHADVLLCDSEVLPDGEPMDYPFPTMGNALLFAYAKALARIWKADDGEAPASFDGAAEDIAAAVWQRCMADVNGMQVLVSSTDLETGAAVYDDPAFSLALLPFFGFCTIDDPTYRDTIALLRSRKYPFWRDGIAPGLASRVHPADPSLAALCSDLLTHRKDDALRTLRALHLTDGIASDRYDAATGASAGSTHAAALAGFLAWSLVHALGSSSKPGADSKMKKKKK